MKVKQLFGNRCLVERYKPKTSKSKILIPDSNEQHDTHRWGKVIAVGDGKFKDKVIEPVVKVGDLVLFQMNGVMENTQKFIFDGRTCMNLLQNDLLARLTGDEVCIENLEMLGEYVLLKHFFRKPEENLVYIPESTMRQSAAEFVYFRILLMGAGVNLPLKVGDEVIANLGRLTPLFLTEPGPNGVSVNSEYCYVHKDWLDGVMVDD